MYDAGTETRQASPTKTSGGAGEQGPPPDQPVEIIFHEAAWRGVFGEYRAAMKHVTEAPDSFHYSTLLVRAGMAIGRRVWFPYAMKLFPNFYCLNFGPTGDRKTTAQRYFADLGSAPVKMISGAGSGEGLADEFQALPPGTPCVISLEEFSELLRRGRWDGATVLQFLTSCFDCPTDYELKYRKNPIALKEPTPSLLSGTTPDWFWQSAKLSDFQGGFGNRLLYFTGNRKPSIPLPVEADLAPIRSKIDALASVPSGPARLSIQATKLWKEFYPAWETKQRNRDPMHQVAVERIPAYVLKIGMVHAGLENSLPEITEDQLTAAILVGDSCTRFAGELLSLQNAGTNPRKELERRILAFVGQQAGNQTTKRQIYKSLWRHYSCAEDFERSFRALVQAGELFCEAKVKGMCIVSIP